MIITKEKPQSGPSSRASSPESPRAVAHASETQQAMKAPQTTQTTQTARSDEPPPYAQNYAASISSSGLLQPSLVSRPIPSPPPPLPPRRSSTNFVYVKTRHEPINGLYNIDPEIDTVALGKDGLSILERKRYNYRHQQKHRHHKHGFFKRVDLPEPNAIFETRQGAIMLNLGIVAGSPASSPSRALVQAATKQGPIHINVLTVHAQRCLKLEVSSRNGNIHILIPRSFSGYIQSYSRHGELKVLPRLSASMQLVYRRNRDMQIVAGRAIETSSPEKYSSWTGDTIHVSSRNGNIVLGYLGEDTVPTEEPGFWKKLAELFHN